MLKSDTIWCWTQNHPKLYQIWLPSHEISMCGLRLPLFAMNSTFRKTRCRNGALASRLFCSLSFYQIMNCTFVAWLSLCSCTYVLKKVIWSNKRGILLHLTRDLTKELKVSSPYSQCNVGIVSRLYATNIAKSRWLQYIFICLNSPGDLGWNRSLVTLAMCKRRQMRISVYLNLVVLVNVAWADEIT